MLDKEEKERNIQFRREIRPRLQAWVKSREDYYELKFRFIAKTNKTKLVWNWIKSIFGAGPLPKLQLRRMMRRKRKLMAPWVHARCVVGRQCRARGSEHYSH